MVKKARAAAAATLVLTLAITFAACGGSGNGDLKLTIGTRATVEEEILGQIYARALEGAGYRVEKYLYLLETEKAGEAVKQGRVSGYPEHVDTALESFHVQPEDLPSDTQTAYERAKRRLEKEGLTAFPPTPFSLTNVVGMLKKTAAERGLKTVSDLRGQSEDLTTAGVSGCHQQINCVGGLEKLYGLAFGGFTYKSTETEPFEALEDKWADLAMLPNTSGRLATEKGRFATLEEDKHLFPAGNAIFVTSPEVVEEAGPDFEAAIVEAQKGLTLSVMQRLDAKVEIERKDPAEVAAEYLQQAGLGD